MLARPTEQEPATGTTEASPKKTSVDAILRAVAYLEERQEWDVQPLGKLARELAKEMARFAYDDERAKHQTVLQGCALTTQFEVGKKSYKYEYSYKGLIENQEKVLWTAFYSDNFVRHAEKVYQLYEKAVEILGYKPGAKESPAYKDLVEKLAAAKEDLQYQHELQRLAIEAVETSYKELSKNKEALEFWTWWAGYAVQKTGQWLTEFPFQSEKETTQAEKLSAVIAKTGGYNENVELPEAKQATYFTWGKDYKNTFYASPQDQSIQDLGYLSVFER